ncbi:MAG: SO_0444 family Cu/Zn efflux transporter [Desulfomonile sp.]
MPAVAGLKKQGANNGASLSFLISTPETGVDSIALTYSLLGPLMALIRPIAAFFTAMAAGIVENVFGESSRQGITKETQQPVFHNRCCGNTDRIVEDNESQSGFRARLLDGMRFAFDDLMSDLTVWFILGILLAGAITALIPDSFFSTTLRPGLPSYLAMIVVSLPMYVCATMSTPIAAALIAKGMSPGTALVLLLAGPATNMATVTIVAGMLGKRSLFIYLASIVVCTLVFAFGTDALFGGMGMSAYTSEMLEASELLPRWVELGSALVLAALIMTVLVRKGPVNLMKRAFSSMQKDHGPSPDLVADAQPKPGGA